VAQLWIVRPSDPQLRVGDYTLNLGIVNNYLFTTPEYPAGIFFKLALTNMWPPGVVYPPTFTPETPGDPSVRVISVEEGVFRE
jgi:hypothetical protein